MKKLKNITTKLQKVDFDSEISKISYYYKYVFNIDVINLYKKQSKNTTEYQKIDNQNENYDYFVLIKDNNYNIFKHKRLEITETYEIEDMINGKFITNTNDFAELLDQTLFEYCEKMYFNDKNSEIIKKRNEKINKAYAKWIDKTKI